MLTVVVSEAFALTEAMASARVWKSSILVTCEPESVTRPVMVSAPP